MISPVSRVSVIGLGYIGLPTAAMFASRKIEVIGVDVNEEAVAAINRGEIHIAEPDLDIVVSAVVNQGYLRATTVPEPADAFLIAVPTPFKDDHIPDLAYIETAAQMIAPVLEKGNLVILESTSPVTTTEQLADWLAAARPDLRFPQAVGDFADVNIAYCPERVLPGRVMHELTNNDRVIGGMSGACSAKAKAVYKTFVEGDCVATTARTAEMVKLVENASRDVAIAFANELSLICDRQDIDVWETIALANRHPRVNILQPGPGVGGHCIAVDPWFIISGAPEEANLIRQARGVNDGKPDWVVRKVAAAVADLDKSGDVTVACFGLAFKADIDDLRESPAVDIARALMARDGVKILVVEPNIQTLPEAFAGQTELVSAEAALSRADIALMLVDHAEFKSMTPDRFSGPIIDTKGVWR